MAQEHEYTRQDIWKQVTLALQKSEAVDTQRAIDYSRVIYSRPSSGVNCHLRKFLDFAKEGVPKYVVEPARMLYFTRMGRELHDIFQHLFAQSGTILGNWKCRECKHVHQLCTYRVCDKCESPDMKYIEIQYRYRNLVCHLDGILMMSKTRGAVIDYKSAASFAVRKLQRPSRDYVEQQREYVALSNVLLPPLMPDFRVVGWALLHLSRDNPFKGHVIFSGLVDQEVRMQHLHRKLALQKRIFEITEFKQVKPLFEHRPCHDKEDHDMNFPYDPCPYLKECFHSEKMISRIKDTVNSSTKLPLINSIPKKMVAECYDGTEQVS